MFSFKQSVLSLTLLSFMTLVAFADEPEFNSQAEEYLRSELAQGKEVNLRDKFSNPAVRSDFVVRLMKSSADRSKGLKIHGAVFIGDFELWEAEIAYSVSLTGCQFVNDADFDDSRFRKDLILDGSHFVTSASFIRTSVEGDLSLDQALFYEDGHAEFAALRVGGELILRQTTFKGEASFRFAEVHRGVGARGVRFMKASDYVSFDRIKITGDVDLRGALFRSSARFSFASVGGNFELNEAEFVNSQTDAKVTFEGLRVGGNGWFHRTVFNSWVDFRGAEFGRSFEATQAMFSAPWQATNLGLKADVADFSQAKFTGGYILEGLQYRQLRADSIDNFLAQANYSTSAYGQAETFLRQQGLGSTADNLYIAKRRRERKSLSPPEKVGSFMLDILVGYGRRPWLAFVWAIGFVAIGAGVFWKRNGMQPQKPEYENRPYSPVWYSLDQFLPFVDLKAADFFEPRTDRRLARLYLRFHILLGWILIPIGLAAISGLVK